MTKQVAVFGTVEKVDLPEFDYRGISAKIDTGAYSGALHVTNIKELPGEDDSKGTLTFSLPDRPDHVVTLKNYIRTFVRSSNGHRARRYLFDTKIIVNGKTYGIRIGLSDRSNMHYDVLIGRRFLAANNILVDVTKNQELDIDRSKKPGVELYENRYFI